MHKKIVLLSILLLPMILVGASCTTSTEQTNANKEQTAASVTPTPTVTNSATPQATSENENTNSDGVGGGEIITNSSVNTSDWLTYENTQYQFRISYPNDMTIEEIDNASTNLGIQNTNVIALISEKNKSSNPKMGIYVHPESLDTTVNLLTDVDKDIFPSQITEITVGGKTAKQITRNSGELPIIMYVIENNNTSFILFGINTEEYADHKTIMNTFTFF